MDSELRELERGATDPNTVKRYRLTLCRVGRHASVITEPAKIFQLKRVTDGPRQYWTLRVGSHYETRCGDCGEFIATSGASATPWMPAYRTLAEHAFPKGLKVPDEDADRFLRETAVDNKYLWFPRAWIGIDVDGDFPEEFWGAWCVSMEECFGLNPLRGPGLARAMFANPSLYRLAAKWNQQRLNRIEASQVGEVG